MNEPSSHLQTLAAALAEEARTAAGEHHPDTDQLLDYHAGRLEPDAEERLRDHLVGCRRCARLLLELAPLAEPDPGDEEAVADFAVHASLRQLESRIEEERIGNEPAAGEPGGRRVPVLSSLPFLRALAASLLVAAVGLTAWVLHLQGSAAELRRTVAAFDQPRPNVEITYLEPLASRGTAAPPAELAPGQPYWVLVLIPEDPRPRPEYEVTLTRADGEVLWRERGLEMGDGGGISLALPRRMLPPGEYLLQLHAVDGEERTPVGEYPLHSSLD